MAENEPKKKILIVSDRFWAVVAHANIWTNQKLGLTKEAPKLEYIDRDEAQPERILHTHLDNPDQKPDLVAYEVRSTDERDQVLENLQSHNIPVIILGRDTNLRTDIPDGIEFFHLGSTEVGTFAHLVLQKLALFKPNPKTSTH